ncbi:MAG: hypothetical protein IKZ16_03440 [Clostridia bacterium]|nr:hypothetical protein [Clostridia bacterium]
MQNLHKKRMGIGLILVSFLFFWNPDVVVLDPLPDVIGYILLSLGLSSLAYLNDHFDQASRLFCRMIALSAGRIVFMFVLFGLVQGNERPTTILLGNFVFGVLELMTLLPAYKHLFEGFVYAGSRGDVGDASVFRPTWGRGIFSLFIHRKSEFDSAHTEVSLGESTSFITVLFVILKTVLGVLPEFAALTDHEFAKFNFYNYVTLFRLLAIGVGAVIGLVWLICILGYFGRVLKDGELISYLRERYVQDILPNTELFVAKRYKLGSFFLLLGVILSLDLPMDGINVLPDVLCAVCLITGIAVLRKYLTVWKQSIAVLCAYAVISLLDTGWQIWFFKIKGFSTSGILKDSEVYDAHVVTTVISVLSALAFVLAVLSVLGCVREIVRQHTGLKVSHVDVQSYSKLPTLHKQLIRGLIPVAVMSAVCAAGSIAYTCLVPYSGFKGEWYYILADIMWLINLLLGAVFVVLFAEKNGDVVEQIDNRYMLAGTTKAPTE